MFGNWQGLNKNTSFLFKRMGVMKLIERGAYTYSSKVFARKSRVDTNSSRCPVWTVLGRLGSRSTSMGALSGNTIFAVVTCWWSVVALFSGAFQWSAESDLTTTVFGGFDTGIFTLGALGHWSAFGLLALNITVSVALTVCAWSW